MTWVKICGMTNLEDALVAVDAGADAVGFVFYEKSPRCVTVETAREIVEKLPANVEKVGVFVNDSSADPRSAVLAAGLTSVQSYFPLEPVGRSESGWVVDLSIFPKPPKFLAALPIGRLIDAGVDLSAMADGLAHIREGLASSSPLMSGIFDTFVLDSGGSQSPGGTGKAFDWSKAVPVVEAMQRSSLKLVVAGGLTPQNVDTAMEILHPWGVDVVSGVEASPGKKDPEKVRAFVQAVRKFDRRVG